MHHDVNLGVDETLGVVEHYTNVAANRHTSKPSSEVVPGFLCRTGMFVYLLTCFCLDICRCLSGCLLASRQNLKMLEMSVSALECIARCTKRVFFATRCQRRGLFRDMSTSSKHTPSLHCWIRKCSHRRISLDKSPLKLC